MRAGVAVGGGPRRGDWISVERKREVAKGRGGRDGEARGA